MKKTTVEPMVRDKSPVSRLVRKGLVFEVRSINMRNVGGPMGGDDSTPDNWSYLVDDETVGMAMCDRDYGGVIKWSKQGRVFSSGDLGYVMYEITARDVWKRP